MEGRALGEVYSRYPFGLKSEFLVNVGEADGVRAGQPALSGGVFVGSVVKAFARAALVQTLFDARAKYPVRIGKKGVDALLVGGGEPRLTLIANAAVLAEGDAVYTASPSLPFGLSVGVVGTVREGRDGLFREAEIALPYNPAEVRAVEIMTEYEPPSF
jgi:cell shape-determining protein MreC